jgi:lambda repressor-like predicted transcriptional regulator
MRLQREDRQIQALAWYQRVFGEGAGNIIARVKAIAAEAMSLAREEGVARSDLHMMVEQACHGPQRVAADAVGALSIVVLAYCEARGLSAEHCERNELARLMSLPMAPRRAAEPVAQGD